MSGVTAWLVAVPAVGQYVALGWPEVAAGALVTAGAAMLPDIDHGSATISRSYGAVTGLVARVVARASGGHRHGTHSALFAAAVAALGWWAGAAGGWWILVPVFLASSLAIGTLTGASDGPRNEIAAAALAVLVHLGQVRTDWLGVALGLGCLAHVLGDMLTPERCPFLWPYRRRFGVGLFTTGTAPERVFAAALVVLNVALALRLGDVEATAWLAG